MHCVTFLGDPGVRALGSSVRMTKQGYPERGQLSCLEAESSIHARTGL